MLGGPCRSTESRVVTAVEPTLSDLGITKCNRARIAQVRSRQTFTVMADALDLQPCYERSYGQMRHDACKERIASARAVIAGRDHLTKSCEKRIGYQLSMLASERHIANSASQSERPELKIRAAPYLHDRGFAAMAAFTGVSENAPPACTSALLEQRRNIECRNGSAQPLKRELAGRFGRG